MSVSQKENVVIGGISVSQTYLRGNMDVTTCLGNIQDCDPMLSPMLR